MSDNMMFPEQKSYHILVARVRPDTGYCATCGMCTKKSCMSHDEMDHCACPKEERRAA